METIFKKGLVLYASYPQILVDTSKTIDYLSKMALDETFDVMEVPYVTDESLWSKVKKIADESGLELISSAAPACNRFGWDLSSTDKEVRLKAVDGVKKVIDFAYAINSKILVFVTGSDPGLEKRGEALKALIQSLKSLSCYCKEQSTNYTLSLSLEPADRDLAHKKLIGPTKEAISFFYSALKENVSLGFTLDMSHIAQLNESLEEATALFRGMVSHAHLSNAVIRDSQHPDYGDKHPAFGVKGSEFTINDGVRFVELLFERCFSRVEVFPYQKPVISVEIRPGPQAHEDLVLAGAKRVLNDIIHQVERRISNY